VLGELNNFCKLKEKEPFKLGDFLQQWTLVFIVENEYRRALNEILNQYNERREFYHMDRLEMSDYLKELSSM
jgi:predicted choloylglycine hydrolase